MTKKNTDKVIRRRVTRDHAMDESFRDSDQALNREQPSGQKNTTISQSQMTPPRPNRGNGDKK